MVQDQFLLNHWHVLAHSQDLQPGTVLQKRLLGEDIVLWHNGDKAFAWQDFCPHRGARLSLGWIEKDNLICSYHGLAYNTEGKCVLLPASPDQSPPSRACIRTYHIQEHYDLLWVCLGTPQYDLPTFPYWEDSCRKVLCGPYHFKSSAQRVVENLIDPAHFPFVHKEIFADSCRPEVTHYDLESHPDGISFKCGLWEVDRKSENPSTQMLFATYEYRLSHPLTGYLHRRGKDDNTRMTIFFMITPVEEEESILRFWILENFLHAIPDPDFLAMQDYIVSQDYAIVESQRPKRLPLDLQAEVHLPSDRYSVAYRKWLKQQGVTFGCI